METRQDGHRPRPMRVGRVLLGTAVASTILFMSAPVASGHMGPDYKARRRHIIERARTQMGAPYRDGGTNPGGFDCSGFTRWVFSGHGFELPRTAAEQHRLGDSPANRRIVQRQNLERGDLVFHSDSDSYVGHVGIYVGNGNFISATSSQGIQIRSLHDPYYWGARWVGGVRLRFMQDVPANGRGSSPSGPKETKKGPPIPA